MTEGSHLSEDERDKRVGQVSTWEKNISAEAIASSKDLRDKDD